MSAATAVATEKAMVGQPAPDFDMASTKNIEKLNENVKLADYRGKWVVLLFYPLDFTATKTSRVSARTLLACRQIRSIRIGPG